MENTKDEFLPNCYIFGFVTSGYNEDVGLANMGMMPIFNASGFVAFTKRIFATEVKAEEHYREVEIRLLNGDADGALIVTWDI